MKLSKAQLEYLERVAEAPQPPLLGYASLLRLGLIEENSTYKITAAGKAALGEVKMNTLERLDTIVWQGKWSPQGSITVQQATKLLALVEAARWLEEVSAFDEDDFYNDR